MLRVVVSSIVGIIVLVITGVAIYGIISGSNQKSAVLPSVIEFNSGEQCDWSVVKTLGDFSYLPLHWDSKTWPGIRPDDCPDRILFIVNAFEKEQPNLKVLSFNIERDQSAHSVLAKIYGIWIYHEKREK
jgi:hypothetical protein